MKRFFLTLASILTLSLLIAQTQELPDLTISGESSFKPYLHKHSLLFDHSLVMGDSLPAFIPPAVSTNENRSESYTMQHRCYLQFEGNVDYGFNSFISYYPTSEVLNALTYTLDMCSPVSKLLSVHNKLFLGTEFSSKLPLSFRLQNVSSHADDFDNTLLDFTVSHHRPIVSIGDFILKDISAQLGYSYLYQQNLGSSYKGNYLNLYLASRLDVDPVDIKAKILTREGDVGFQLSTNAKDEYMNISRLGVSVLADEYTFIPSLEFLYRSPIQKFGVVSIANEPLLESNTFLSHMEENPWIAFDDGHKLKKIPLNFKLGLEYLYPEKMNFTLAYLTIKNNSRYEIDSPVLINSINYSIPTVRYTDIFSNLTIIEAFFKLDEVNIHQGMELDLSYLSEDDYRRAPYRPLLNLDSRVSYNFSRWFFSLDILQKYFTVNHLGNDLPEAVIINIGAEYREANYAVYFELANLFNRKQYVFSELPAQGRNFYLGLKHRF